MIVEDDDDIRDSLIAYLEERGYQPIGASNGKLALELLADPNLRPCVIVLDAMMPVMDGRSFREEQLRSSMLAKIPVVLISARGTPTELEDEVDAHLAKPLDLLALMRLIEEYCRTASLAQGPDSEMA